MTGLVFALVVAFFGHSPVGHLKHGFAGVNCARCHAAFQANEPDGTLHLPKDTTCIECHQERKPTCTSEQCATCHVNDDTPGALKALDEAIFFDHVKHLERMKGDCIRCHRGAAQADATGGGALPTMADCRGCHAEWIDGLLCTKCHASLAQYAIVPVTQQAHRPGFFREHGRHFERGGDLCQQCHGQTFCRDCHDRRNPLPPDFTFPDRPERAVVHRMGWRQTHATDARLWPDTCTGCHAPQDCQKCHENAGFKAGDRQPHPADYAGMDHGRDARRDLLTCATCHSGSGGDICVTCHAVGRPGGSPHAGRNPGGDKGKRPCRECHGGAR